MNIRGFEWRDRKVLVTGASGFKGSWLAAALTRAGAKVYGTVRHVRDQHSAFEVLGLDREVIEVQVDMSDKRQVLDLVNSIEPSVVFHLAAKALVPVALRDPSRTYEVNIGGTVNLLEACRQLGVVEKVLICSTDHVFGNVAPDELPTGGFVETSPVGYGGPYDTSKAAMELVVRSYNATYTSQLPGIAITRCANVYGFGDTNQRRVIPLFVRSAVATRKIPLKYRYGARQFIHVSDVVCGYVLVASTLPGRSDKSATRQAGGWTPTFHFALERYGEDGTPCITMEKLAETVANVCDATVDDTNCIDYAPNENRVQALNCAKTRESLGWQTRKDFRQSLADLAEWYRNPSEVAMHSQINQDLAEAVHNLNPRSAA